MTQDQPEKPPTLARRRRQAAANREADLQADALDDRPGDSQERGSTDDLPDEREEWFRSPGMSRMRMEFSPADLVVMRSMEEQIDRVVLETFADAYRILNRVYDVVREQEVDETTGELLVDGGFPVWRRDYTGNYVEDWSRLLYQQREDLLFEVTTRIFEWEQRREHLWTQAMFAKAIFTERFAIEYDAPMSGTIDDRNAVGNAKAAEDRYFALMQTSLSSRADAVVRSMNSLMLRLRDSMQR